MQDMNFESTLFGFYDDELDFSTPVVSPAGSGRPRDSEQPISESCVEGSNISPLPYTIDFKMRLRKGRLMKLLDETIDNVVVAPGVFWKETLHSKLLSNADKKVPKPQYEHDDTIINISTSKRGEPDFEKPFGNQEIDWVEIENKLRSWSNPKHKLRVTILVIYKESPQAATKKAGRGATKKHIAALETLVAQQTGTGTGAVWQDVYRLFHCNSKNVCTNYGFYCWINDSKHYKLDDKVLEQLVDYAEEGMALKSHADVPDGIREVIIRRGQEDTQRKKRKATAGSSDRCCSHCRHCGDQADCLDRTPGRRVGLIKLQLPMGIDQAPEQYSDWLGTNVANADWRASYRAAGIAAMKKGYELQWFCDNKTAGIEMLKANGILPGIAEQFVNKIVDWAEVVNGN